MSPPKPDKQATIPGIRNFFEQRKSGDEQATGKIQFDRPGIETVGFYIIQFVPIVLVESLVLWRMKWGSLPKSFFDTLMMNFASFIGLLLGLGPYIQTTGPWGLTLFATYSTMVEGAVLMLLERHSPKKVWLCVLVANIISGAMLAAETLFATLHATK